jgi:REP element-mobilizing transposase RayT
MRIRLAVRRRIHPAHEKYCRAGAPPATIFPWVILSGFVTICVANRDPVLANEQAFRAFKAAVAKLQHWRVLAAILMPDHLHVIVSPTDGRDTNVGNFSAALKRWIRREVEAAWNWQPGCFDRLLRSDESLHEKWLYVQDNPVRAGLVSMRGRLDVSNWARGVISRDGIGRRRIGKR